MGVFIPYPTLVKKKKKKESLNLKFYTSRLHNTKYFTKCSYEWFHLSS